MKKLLLPIAFMMAFALNGCGREPERPKATPMEISDLCQYKNNEKYVTIEGFLDVGTLFSCSGKEGNVTCGFNISKENPLENDNVKNVGLFIKQGDEKDQVKKYDESQAFKMDLLHINNKNGQKITASKKVRLSGKIYMGLPEDKTCIVTDVHNIENI
jgi:hypothetical protein